MSQEKDVPSPDCPALPAPGDSALLCALCGPIREEELKKCDLKLSADPDLSHERRHFFVDAVWNWKDLREHYRSNPWLRQAAKRLEAWRSTQSSTPNRPQYGGSRETIVGRVRYALVAGLPELLNHLYHEYTRTFHGLGDRTCHSIFWEQVMGSGLEGANEVPGESARRTLSCLLTCHFAFTSYPAGALICGKDVNYSPCCDLIHALRTADTAYLEKARKTEAQAGLASAALLMLQGEWKSAYTLFTHYLSAPSENPPPEDLLLDGGKEILALYATFCALRAEISPASIRKMLRQTRQQLDRCLDLSYPSTEETFRLLHNLEWLTACRSGKSDNIFPIRDGIASILPLLMGYRQLPAKILRALDSANLPGIVRKLKQSDQLLIAAYTAQAALSLLTADAPQRTELLQLLRELPSVAPLVDIPEPITPTEQQMRRVEQWVDTCAPPNKNHLYWDLVPSADMSRITSLELRIADSPERNGRRIPRESIYLNSFEDLMDEADRQALPLLQALEYGHSHHLSELACLAGHPRVRLIKNNVPEPIILQSSMPELQIIRKGDSVRIYPSKQQPPSRILAHTDYSLTIPQPSRPEVLAGEQYLHGITGKKSGCFIIDNPDPLRLQELLTRIAHDYTLCGDIHPPGTPERDSTPQLVIKLHLQRRVLSAQLLIRLLPETTQLLPPCIGLHHTLLRIDGELICVQRDWETERELVKTALAQCPLLRPTRRDSYPPQLQALRSETAQLGLLLQLQAAQIPVIWEGDKRLSTYNAPSSLLRLTLHEHQPGWFEIGGELALDASRILDLRQLLESKIQTNHLLLSDGTQLLTDAQLTGLIRSLQAACCQDRQRRMCISRATLPALTRQWGSILPASWRQASPNLDEHPHRIPQEFQDVLRPYQREGFQWMAARTEAGLGMCLADDMGLGKTIQCLALLQYRAHDGAALIVAPASLLGNWEEEAHRFAPKLQVLSYTDWTSSEPPPPGSLMLASYGQLASAPSRAQSTCWSTLVLDEAQHIRNATTKRSQTILTLQTRARVALTGTPIENDITDLWSIMNFLNPGMLGTQRTFRSRFRQPSDLEELRNIVRPLILRRTREQVLPQLPALTEVLCTIQLNDEERALYEASRQHALQAMQQQSDATTLFTELTRLRRLCCHGRLVSPDFTANSSKLSMLMELIHDLRKSGHKALVFSQFTDVLDLVEPLLTQAGITFLRLDGSTPTAQRPRIVRQFQNEEAEILLISLRAGGVGLNLTAASYVILLDPWWNPAVESQAAARSHRMGQTQPVTLYRIIADHTVEQRVLALHQSKTQLADTIITEGTLPLSELRQLLE